MFETDPIFKLRNPINEVRKRMLGLKTRSALM